GKLNLNFQPRLPANPQLPEIAEHAHLKDKPLLVRANQLTKTLLAKGLDLDAHRAERRADLEAVPQRLLGLRQNGLLLVFAACHVAAGVGDQLENDPIEIGSYRAAQQRAMSFFRAADQSSESDRLFLLLSLVGGALQSLHQV